METISLSAFNATINSITQPRLVTYTNFVSLTLVWEAWNYHNQPPTDVTGDFQAILKLLDPPRAQHIAIPANTYEDGRHAYVQLERVIRGLQNTTNQTLALIHYAGHPTLDNPAWRQNTRDAVSKNQLTVIDPFLANITKGTHLFIDNAKVDIVYIFDCYNKYQFPHIKKIGKHGRVIELLAEGKGLENLDPPKTTLTRKLRDEIGRRKHLGHQFVEMADLAQTLAGRSQPNSINSVHHLIYQGTGSVCLTFNGPSSIDPASIPPSLDPLTFSVFLSESMTLAQIKEFLVLINSLPIAFRLSLDAVYEATKTGCTILLLQAPHSVIAKLSGLRGIGDITEVTYVKRSRRELTRESEIG
ncbi:hypothetical protein N7456_001164 [Penicillium angulare]|uniref:Uncharacterized protein n=1 Tax=Penicillium angulare TaxID=116970 RepID=A0A9W9GDH8_9EURO|nr:hypothetical protein N7456_001164 [Penicillium angulare]